MGWLTTAKDGGRLQGCFDNRAHVEWSISCSVISAQTTDSVTPSSQGDQKINESAAGPWWGFGGALVGGESRMVLGGLR